MMRILKITILTILFLANNAVFSQHHKKTRDKVRALKIAFITEKLDLSAKEAEKFWPIYNTYDKKIKTLEREERHKLKKSIKNAGGFDKISDDFAKKVITKMHQIDADITKLKKELDLKLVTILPYKKILQLKHLEREFVRNLMRKFKRRKRME